MSGNLSFFINLFNKRMENEWGKKADELAIFGNISSIMGKLNGQLRQDAATILKVVYTNSYSSNATALANNSAGANINPDAKIKEYLSGKPIDGFSFWDLADKQMASLQGEAAQLVRSYGKNDISYAEFQGEMRSLMSGSQAKVMGLVNYQAMLLNNLAVIDSSEEMGFSDYLFVNSADSKTGGCKLCQSLNGKVFAIKDAEPGVNFPPLHINCRCHISTLPQDDDRARMAPLGSLTYKGQIERIESTYGAKRAFEQMIADAKGDYKNQLDDFNFRGGNEPSAQACLRIWRMPVNELPRRSAAW